MLYTVATDGERISIASDGLLFGRSVLSVEDENPYDRKVGIGVAMMNCYLALPKRNVYSLEGYKQYLLIYVDPAYMLEMVCAARQALWEYHCRPGLISESYGCTLKFEFVSIASTLEEIRKDIQKIKTGAWQFDQVYEQLF